MEISFIDQLNYTINEEKFFKIIADDNSEIFVNQESNINYQKEKPQNFEEYLCNLSASNVLVFSIKQNTLYFSSDIFGQTDLYYKINSEEICISLDFTKLISRELDSVDNISLFDFFTNGYIRGKYTPYKNLFKTYPLSYYKFQNSQLEIKDLIPKFEYDNFKDSFSSSFDKFVKNDKTAVLYSGGIDSTSILKYGKINNLNFHPIHMIFGQGSRFEYNEAFNNAKRNNYKCDFIFYDSSFLKYTMVDTKNQLNSVHGNRLGLLAAIEYSKKFSDKLISGQNADTTAQLRNTRIVSLKNFIRNFLLFGFSSNAIRTYFTRLITNGKLNNKKFQDLYRTYHLNFKYKSIDYDILLTFSLYNNSNPFIFHLDNNTYLDEDTYNSYFLRCKEFVDEIYNQFPKFTLRQKLLILFYRSCLIGGDNRTITLPSNELKIKNLQIFSSPEVFNYFFYITPTYKEVFKPKFDIRKYSNYKKPNYKKLFELPIKDAYSLNNIKSSFNLEENINFDLEELDLKWFNKVSVSSRDRFMENWELLFVQFRNIQNFKFEKTVFNKPNESIIRHLYEYLGNR